MRLRSSLLIALFMFTTPMLAFAEVSVIQDYCEQYVEGSDDVLIIHFSVVNYNLPDMVCDMQFIPEPQPVWEQCEVTGIVAAPGWTGSLNPVGGADFFANTPQGCVETGQMLSGFQLIVGNPDFCCYVVQFTGPTGEVMQEQVECFNCSLVGNENQAWGTIKSIYN